MTIFTIRKTDILKPQRQAFILTLRHSRHPQRVSAKMSKNKPNAKLDTT